MREYDQIAAWYASVRSAEVGPSDLAPFVSPLAPGAKILDLGCGDGIPISRHLIQAGFDLVGLDSSSEMITRYRAHFPTVPTRCEPAQTAHFDPETFDAVVAWGVLFHLPKAEQQTVITKVSGWLKPGGRFLFTSGDVEGVRESEMGGVMFRYTSLGSDRYRRLLEESGMTLTSEHRDDWGSYVYIARKPVRS